MLDREESVASFYYDYYDEENDFIEEHASLSYDDLSSEQASRPLEFPTPVVFDAVMGDLTAADHRTGVEYDLKNVLRRASDPNTAYLWKKKLAKSTYGYVKLCVVLRRVNSEERDCNEAFGVQWRSTGEFVAIKCSSWQKIQAMRGRHLVDAIKEISVLQLIGDGGNDEKHVMGCLEVLQDEDYLYTVMPYYPGGDLYGKLDLSGIQLYPDEDEAKEYFKQLLQALVFLQKKGICHRNVCIENLLLDDHDQLVLIDSGLSLRIPYCDPCNPGGVTDASEGTRRRLIKPQGQCGRLKYMAPEMFDEALFDGHATDLWAAGITLFITLVGLAPFEVAQSSDMRFQKIAEIGELEGFLESLEVSLSHEAMDLLQNMLWSDPRDRLTLAEVLSHPWVLGQPMPTRAPERTMAVSRLEDIKEVQEVPSAPVAPVLQRVEKPISDTDSEDPATVATTGGGPNKTHQRRKSGPRDLMGKLRFIMPAKKIGCGSHGSVSSIDTKSSWKTPFRAGKM